MTADRGSVSVLAVSLIGAGLVLAAATLAAGQVVAARARAVNAADAAALAAAPVTFRSFGAAGTPTAEAARFAVSNGVELVSCRCPVDRSYADRTVEVEVRLDVRVLGTWPVSLTARAAAEFQPVVLLTG